MRRRHGLLAAAIVAALSTGAAASAEPPRPPAHPDRLLFPPDRFQPPTAEGHRHELSSGPVLYVVADRTLPLVEIAVALPVGAADDPPGSPGLASLTAVMLRRGGSRRHPPAGLDDLAASLGAEIDSVGGRGRSGARLSVPTWSLAPALAVFFDLLAHPRFDPGRLAEVVANLREGIERRRRDPGARFDLAWRRLLHGLAIDPAEELRSIGGMSPDDLAAFHRRTWRPEEMVVAVSGDVDPEAIPRELERRFADWPARAPVDAGGEAAAPTGGSAATAGNGDGAARSSEPAAADAAAEREPETAPEAASEPASEPAPATPGLYHLELDLPQVLVALGHTVDRPLPWTSAERWAARLLAEVLGGGGAVSRIAGRLRTAEGLVYRASARLDLASPGGVPGEEEPAKPSAEAPAERVGALIVELSTGPGHVERTVALCREELERLRRDGVEEWELEAARRHLVGELRLGLDTAQEVAGRLAENELLGRPGDWLRAYRSGLAAVTRADVAAAARRLLRPDELVVLVGGRWEEISDGAAPGKSAIEQALDTRVVHLSSEE